MLAMEVGGVNLWGNFYNQHADLGGGKSTVYTP